ncbi:hypothetical protein H5410_053030 [Solanum commersonii]|uniref:Pectinesterase inhibitor domain-containing protein n=1 Tax=Solanum commersonii TaxID=4109 RepID=A0A9J5X2Q2_SOLCO|nr:hypothetical protein H5410_053030 [Solanum commersonii]
MFVERLDTSRFASTLLDRTLRALLRIMFSTYSSSTMFNKDKKTSKKPVLIQCLQVCKENYGILIDNTETSIKDFDANDFPGARSFAAGVASAPNTCEETFNEPPARTSPIKSKDDNLMNFIDLTVSLMNQFTN